MLQRVLEFTNNYASLFLYMRPYKPTKKDPQERIECQRISTSKRSRTILATVEFLGLKAIFNLIHR